ncbi:MAG: hypothetical protein AAF726_03255 [Planctomycetota bacterium]
MSVALVLLLALPQSTPPLEIPTLDRADLAAWREHLRPNEVDLRYARIDWAPTFLEGVRRADADGKPLLLWLMNGHPLGCT